MYCQAHLGERLLADCCLPVCGARASLCRLSGLWQLWQLLAAALVLGQHPSSVPTEPSNPAVMSFKTDLEFAHVMHNWLLSIHAEQTYHWDNYTKLHLFCKVKTQLVSKSAQGQIL